MLEGVKSHLVTNGMQSDSIYIGIMPDDPANAVALYVYDGSESDLHWRGQYPNIQVVIRNQKYIDGYAIAKQIYSILHGARNISDNNGNFLIIKARSPVLNLQQDENKRFRFSINFESIYESNY